jgi:N-acetylmuramoyl-L-alanine amidase
MPFCWTGTASARHYRSVSFFLALLAMWLAGTPVLASTVDRVDVGTDRITIHFNGTIARATSLIVDNPQRIAVDIDGAKPGHHASAGGPVDHVRQASHGDDGARIVFDLSMPAIVTEGHIGDDARSLTLMLRTVDDATFARAAADRQLRFVPPFSYGQAVLRRGIACRRRCHHRADRCRCRASMATITVGRWWSSIPGMAALIPVRSVQIPACAKRTLR